jgi:hypothetical protein
MNLVGRDEAEAIASLVWRIAFEEGYSLEEWADLLESLKTLPPAEGYMEVSRASREGG